MFFLFYCALTPTEKIVGRSNKHPISSPGSFTEVNPSLICIYAYAFLRVSFDESLLSFEHQIQKNNSPLWKESNIWSTDKKKI
ncbi:MAG: hypothetical protein BV458_07140 [Thermoplasmata archaeon M9B2D]|nr:MAG: hypothetical protein BV458_07140 [Thermoplasmata archaeon M9B2D]